MVKKNIAWITFNAFLDTDLYVVKEISKYYNIDWHIIRSENDKFEYLSILRRIENENNLKIKLHVCGRRLRNIECVGYYNKLLSSVNKSGADLIYTSMAGAPYYMPVLAMKTRKNKVVVAIHNVHVPKGGKAYSFFKAYNKFTISNFTNFQTFSKAQYKDLIKIAPNKNIFYAPFILKDYGQAKKTRKNKEITFLNFGNIRNYKRIDILIKAAQKTYERLEKSFKIIIAGQCDDWDKYQKLIKYDFLFDIRLGRVDNKEIPELFNESDYFVAPYQDIAQSGSSVVAVNYGKPIIASRLPAFEEYIVNKKTGYLVKPADVDSLADVMTEILSSNNNGYEELVKNLMNYREIQFSTEAIVCKYKEYIDEIISK